MKTLLIMAGGTGGHVMPALAVANRLREQGVKVIWMGTRAGIEFELVPKAGFELKLIKVKGLRGSGFLRKLSMPFVLTLAAFQATTIILSSKANALLGMGGFVSGPGALVGRLLRKPLILHEQNAIAGTTNKLLAPFASRVLTGFDKVKALKTFTHVGNPVKPEIINIKAPDLRLAQSQTTLNILVLGGSQGALVFNQALPSLLATLQTRLGENVILQVHHQSGKDKNSAVQALYSDTSISSRAITVTEFIDDMAAAYSWSDMVICRAGAMTVAEVAAAGAVALFVPFPYAIDDHQFYNAQALADSGAAICLRQDEFVKGRWLETLLALSEDRNRLIKMATLARQSAKPNAAQTVADICQEVMDA